MASIVWWCSGVSWFREMRAGVTERSRSGCSNGGEIRAAAGRARHYVVRCDKAPNVATRILKASGPMIASQVLPRPIATAAPARPQRPTVRATMRVRNEPRRLSTSGGPKQRDRNAESSDSAPLRA